MPGGSLRFMFALSLLGGASLGPLASVQAQSPGSPKFDLPGAIWVDRDSDGRVDGYVHNGQVHSDPSVPAPLVREQSSASVIEAVRVSPDTLKRWGALARLVGSSWQSQHGIEVLTFKWEVPGEAIAMRRYIGNGYYRHHIVFRPSTPGVLKTRVNEIPRADATVLADGSVFHRWSKDALILINPDSFEWVNGNVKDGKFIRAAKQDVYGFGDGGINGQYRRMSVAEAQGFTSTLAEYRRAEAVKKEAERQRKAQGGGLLGALQGAIAGASGMATGGGGADAAIAGAVAGAVAGASGVEAGAIGSGFAQGAAEVNASNAEMQRSFERSMARAGAPGYEDRGGRTNGDNPARQEVASDRQMASNETSQARSVPVYFVVGMRPRENDTRNPMCYSSNFNVTAVYKPGSDGAVLAAMEPMKSTFLEKCGRLGQVDGVVNPVVNQSPSPHAQDFRVQLP